MPRYAKSGYCKKYKPKGKGAYSFGKLVRKIGSSDVGRAARKGAIAMIKKYTGSGLYEGNGLYRQRFGPSFRGKGVYVDNGLIKGSKNTAMSGTFANDETGAVTFSARQFVRIINAPSSSGFVTTTIGMQPALKSNFPSLAGIAANFEEYKVEQLVYEIQNTLDGNIQSVNGQQGTMIMLADYNNQNQDFLNIEEMMQYHGAVSGRITDSLRMGVECDSSKGRSGRTLYTRQTPVGLTDDINEYDLGSIALGFNNTVSSLYNQQIGYLWCHFTITFMKPKLPSTRNENIATCLIGCTSGGQTYQAPFTTSTANLQIMQASNLDMRADLILGTGTPITNSTGGQPVTITAGFTCLRLTFPSYYTGDVEINARLEGTGITASGTATYGMQGNVSVLTDLYGTNDQGTGDAPANIIRHVVGSTGFIWTAHFRVRAATNGQDNYVYIMMDNLTAATTVTQAIAEVREYFTAGHVSTVNNSIRFVSYDDRSVQTAM